MLVANPGQTPYSLISKKPCHNKPARNNAVSTSIKYTPSSSANITSSKALASKKMTAVTEVPSHNEQHTLKTLSVRISRETDMLKHSVQKAVISKIPSQFTSVLSLYTVPPTNIHRYPERTESLSVDSLRTEMCHFKPIRTVPTTPTKRSKSVIIRIPKAKFALNNEIKCDESERSKPSSNLSATVVLTSPRVSAFSYVALIDKIPAYSEKTQQHKAKSKSVRPKGNESLKKKCIQPRVLMKHITTISSDAKVKEELSLLTPVRHRTRRFTKTLTTASTVEHQMSQTSTQLNIRVTRKRQPIRKNEDSLPIKNAKLIKDCSKPTKNVKKRTVNNKQRRIPSRQTPPVTRSRLKQSMIITRRHYEK